MSSNIQRSNYKACSTSRLVHVQLQLKTLDKPI